jgi:hypothetical protein
MISSMNYTISFQERAKLAMELLSKQSPVTLTMARNQAMRLKAQSKIAKIKITQDVISSLPRQHQSQDGQDP